MPTGYTADVKDGTLTDFATFAMRCARAFGALIDMRDDAMDAPIPTEFKSSSYHQEELAEARAELARLKRMTTLRADIEASKAHTAAMADWNRMGTARKKTRERYESMLARVRAWQPPSAEHAELKRFMESQLTESIQFDCGDTVDWKPKPMNGAAWLAQRIERAEKDVAYHEKALAEETKRAADRSRWVQQLRDSLSEKQPVATR